MDIHAALAGGYAGSAAWGDYDNDGDLDILLTGDYSGVRVTKVYSNDGGDIYRHQRRFDRHSIAVLRPGGTTTTTATWISCSPAYDRDLVGVAKVYSNDGGTFTDIGASLSGGRDSDSAWGDYDNDGDLDILLIGQDASYNRVARVYRNDNSVFTVYIDIDPTLPGVASGAVDWGDYDNDGDLDILLTGEDDNRPRRQNLPQ